MGLMSVGGGYVKTVAVAQLSRFYSNISGYIDWDCVPKSSWSYVQVPVDSSYMTMDSVGVLTCVKPGQYHFAATLGSDQYGTYAIRIKVNDSVVYTDPSPAEAQSAPRMLDYTTKLKAGDTVRVEFRSYETHNMLLSLMIWGD